MGIGGQCHSSDALLPGKTWYPLYWRLSWSQGWSGRVQKILRPRGFDPWTIQPVVNPYTDRTIPDHGVGNKDKGVPYQARCGSEGSRKFRLPDFMTFGT